jgi:uncharacterized SAM-binding protein YcdF (DUF218 family)
LPGRRPDRQRLSLVRPDDAGERVGARAQCRRHRGADRGRLAHQRTPAALELRAAARGRRLLITGVNPTTHSGEILRLVPEHRRWFNCCVDLDHSATNTIGNAIETRRWVKARGFPSVIVVTSNFHMPRAMAEIGHQLPGVELVPFAVVSDKVRVEAWWENPATARLLFLEYLKYIVARGRMWLPTSFA